MDEYELSTLTAEEIFNTYVKGANPHDLIAEGRTVIASRLMVEKKLKDAAAYFAADQILAHAYEMIEAHTSVRPAEY